MENKQQKQFFASHSKSSAIVVSVVIHALLILAAFSLVAVSVVVKPETTFDARQVHRPKMNLRKLQVPVNVKKTPKQPRLRKQIVVAPKLGNALPDIKMPEIVGVKGGLGAGSGGFGGAASLGFSIPQINLFGVEGSGERIFFALDASGQMMVDEIGGVRSYEIIKSEMIRILKQLNSTVLFNVVVYQEYSAKKLFSGMVPANSENVSTAVAWLEPLNRFTKDRSSQDQYGSKTTGEGGSGIDSSDQIEPLKGGVSHWASPTMEAMKELADTVYILTSGWGFLAYKTGDASGWSDSDEARFQKKVAAAKTKLAEENNKRVAAGDPPRIIPSVNYERNLVEIYFPDTPLPPFARYEQYTPLDLVKAFVNMRKKRASGQARPQPGIKKQDNRDGFVINVIQFCKKGDSKNDDFVKLTALLKGQYRLIQGLEAVQGYEHAGAE